MGRATAIEFARQGASVTIADVNAAAGREALTHITQAGGHGLLVIGDVARASVCRRVVQRTVERFGGVDVLFNNVGIQPAGSYLRIEDLSEQVWDRILAVNLTSYFLM